MKLLPIAFAFLSAGALACPADDVKDTQAPHDQAVAQAKAPARASAAAKPVASKKAPATKVADKAAAEAARKSSL